MGTPLHAVRPCEVLGPCFEPHSALRIISTLVDGQMQMPPEKKMTMMNCVLVHVLALSGFSWVSNKGYSNACTPVQVYHVDFVLCPSSHTWYKHPIVNGCDVSPVPHNPTGMGQEADLHPPSLPASSPVPPCPTPLMSVPQAVSATSWCPRKANGTTATLHLHWSTLRRKRAGRGTSSCLTCPPSITTP